MALDGFMKIGDLKSDAKVEGYEDQIKIITIDLEVEQPTDSAANAAGATAGNTPRFPNIALTIPMCKASPLLFVAAAIAKKFEKVTITLTRNHEGKQLKALVVDLTDVIIAKHSMGGDCTSEESSGFVDELELNYDSIKITYDGGKGSIPASYVRSTKKHTGLA